jgi:hypothetical protein
MIAVDPPKTAAEMMSDILGNVGNLVRDEADLARAEVAASLRKAGASLGAMAVALVLATVGLHAIAAALIAFAVAFGIAPHWASLGVGAVVLLIAMAVFNAARASLQQIGFVPTRAARNVSRDATAIKDSFNDK